MTTFQKTVKNIAMAVAILLAVGIIAGFLSLFGLFGGFFGSDAVAEDVKIYSVSSEITSLKVEISAADFQVKQGEAFSVESNLKHLTVEDKNGILTIKETKKFGSTYTGAVLTLYVPADIVFEKAYIATGAGRLIIESLSAETLDFELGAGEVSITSLIAAQSADIEGGAGKITISGGELHNLDFQMGVGQLNLTSALAGECEFELGVGQSNITVIGNKDDYKLDIEKGIGSITVDGTSVSNTKVQRNGDNNIEISGGIGDINLNFKESETK